MSPVLTSSLVRRLSLLGLELGLTEQWMPAASRAHRSNHGLPSGLHSISNGIEAQVASAVCCSELLLPYPKWTLQGSFANINRMTTCAGLNRHHIVCSGQYIITLTAMVVQVLVTNGETGRCMRLATSRIAVSLAGSQMAAALAIVDGIVASLARGMTAQLPDRKPPHEGV